MGKIPFLNPSNPMLRTVESIQQDTPDCANPLQPGPVRLVPASGDIDRTKADSAANAGFYGITTHYTPGNCPSTVVRRGVVYGYDFTNVNYGVSIYVDNDGDLSTDPGTVTVRVGRVIRLKGEIPGAARQKALSVEA